MKKIDWGAVILITIAVLICAALIGYMIYNTLSEGILVNKTFIPAHTETRSRAYRIGKTWHRRRYKVNVPDEYFFYVEDEEGKRHDRWQVSKDTYEQYEIGDWVTR
ncbi:MAG: hypothetical protein IJ523_07930 [Succinivibrionaceae bacterium]|nr:hypothetical protein [Succinivibrionaceae bacterium]